jgi:hypothetical protein
MKTNVSIELNDEARDVLANLMDDKDTSRLATRKDVVALCEQHIGGLVATAEDYTYEPEVTDEAIMSSDLYTIDPGDRALMARPDDDSYVRGWNQVKRSKG